MDLVCSMYNVNLDFALKVKYRCSTIKNSQAVNILLTMTVILLKTFATDVMKNIGVVMTFDKRKLIFHNK